MKLAFLLTATCLMLSVPACSQSKPAISKSTSKQPLYIQNGDFSTVKEAHFPHWATTGAVKPEATSGAWKKLTARFKSGSETKFAFTFAVPRGASGSVWIDNLTIDPPLAVKNAGFEEPLQNGRLPGWDEKDMGRTAFLDTSRASEGKQSLRISHAHEAIPETLFIQDIPVEPGKEYALSFDIFVGDDFQGEAKGWLFNARHNVSLDFEYENLIGSKLVEDRDRLGKFAVAMSPTEGSPAGITQEISVMPGANLRASFDLENKAFKGNVLFTAVDIASGKTLGQIQVTDSQEKVRTVGFSFQSFSHKMRVNIQATGQGYLRLDNVAVALPRIVPTVQQAQWLPAADNFKIPASLQVYVQGKSGVAIDGALGLLNKDLKPYNVVAAKSAAATAPVRILIGEPYKVAGRGEEAYTLEAGAKGVTIKAAKEAGAFYGVMTLLQLIESRNGKPVFLPCKITDYPDMPIRGFLYADAEQAARNKMNTLMVSTGYLVSPAEKQQLQDLVKESQSLNLDFVPFFSSLMGGYYVQGINPNLAAGIWIQDEKVVLRGTEPAPLANPYVIRTAMSDVKLKSADGQREYVLGKDYQVIDGEMKYPYDNPSAKRFAIARLPGSAIPDGETVLAGYDYVSHTRKRTDPHIPYVPLEPEANKLMTDFLTDLAKSHDFRYINSAADLHEFFIAAGHLETDSRVIKSGKKPIELLVEEAKRQAEAIQKGNPKTRPFQWTGDVGENAKAAGPYLPKDSLINIWGYDATWPVSFGREALDYWTKLGYETTVMPWDNVHNIRSWAQVVAQARRKGYNCSGIIGSGWEGRPTGFQETANVSWRVPKPGEPGYIALPAWPAAASEKSSN